MWTALAERRRSGSLGRFCFFLGLAVVILPYLPTLLDSNAVLLYRDLTNVQIPMKSVWVRGVTELWRVPQWNPYQWSGAPFLADPNLGALYPLNLFLLLFRPGDMARGVLFFLVLHHALIYCGGFLLFRELRIRVELAALGAIALGINGFSLSSDNFVNLLCAQAAVPFYFCFFLRARRQFGRWDTFGAALALAWPVYAGDPQFSVMLALCSLFLVGRATWRRFAWIAVDAVLLAGPQLFPTLYYLLTQRRFTFAAGLPEQMHWSLHPLRAMELLFPLMFGARPGGDFFGQSLVNHPDFSDPFVFSVYAGAASLAPLLLCAFPFLSHAAKAPRRRWRVSLAGCFLLLLPLGVHSPIPVYQALYYVVPFWRGFRYPERLSYWGCLFLLYLGLLGAEFLLRKRGRVSREYAGGIVAFLATAAGAGFYLARHDRPLAPVILSSAIVLASTAALLARGKARPYAGFLFLLIGVADFSRFAPSLIWSQSKAITEAASLPFLGTVLEDRDKAKAAWPATYAERFYGEDRFRKFNSDLAKNIPDSAISTDVEWAFLSNNLPGYFGIKTVGGLTTLSPPAPLPWRTHMSLNRLMDIQAVRYLLLRDGRGSTHLVINNNCLPYAFVPRSILPAKDERAAAALLERPDWDYQDDVILSDPPFQTSAEPKWVIQQVGRHWDEIGAELKAEGASSHAVLVINESFDPNWTAWGGGRPLRVVEANGWAIGIALPPAKAGEAVSITLRYDMPAFHWGLLAGLLGIALAFVAPVRRVHGASQGGGPALS